MWVVAVAVTIAGTVALVLVLHRLGGGSFPWVQFYAKGKESGFSFREINLLRRVAVEGRLDNPTSLFWSIKQLDRALRDLILKLRARNRDEDQDSNWLLAKLFELRKKIEFSQPKYSSGIKSSRQVAPRTRLSLNAEGRGPFESLVVENSHKYMAISYPENAQLPEGYSFKGKRVGIYFWRTDDAGYFFQAKVIEDHSANKYPILHVSHTDNLVRQQKRKSVRVETDSAAMLYPMKRIEAADERQEPSPGLRCRLRDVSEDGAAVLVGGRAKVGMPIKLQFPLGDGEIVLCGVVKTVNFNEKTNRSVLHVQAVTPSASMRNTILIWVYDLFGDRKKTAPGRNGVSRSASSASPSPQPRTA